MDQSKGSSRRVRHVVVGIGVSGVVLAAATFSEGRDVEATAMQESPRLLVPGFTYMGNASCVSCHDVEEPKQECGQEIGDEFTIWFDNDPHAKSYTMLKEAESKAIAAKLGIPDASTSDRCLNCHALNAPEAQRGERFDIAEGNSCESCHGPAEKWLTDHEKECWTKSKREDPAVGTAGLLKEYGLIDTRNVAVRAQTCIACHLGIDKELLDAGHPSVQFEMYGYNYYAFDKEFTPHWEDPVGELFDAKLWAVGQAAALAAVKGKSDPLEPVYAAGVAVAKKHFGSDSAEGLAKAAYTAEKCAAAAADLAAAAGEAKSDMGRKIIGFGVTALGSAVFDAKKADVPDEFWDASDAATSGTEAGFAEACKKMADIAGK